jgi:catechol 2,3-dioxygenase-like lactoylglutathione lyase family enzyme
MSLVRRLARVDLVSCDPARLADFYGALGFQLAGHTLSTAAGRSRLDVKLGGQRIGLVTPQGVARPYPPSVPGWSPYFQHVAIVVSDMARAYQRLSEARRWTAISTDGPEQLPEASGGVTAFKFRDPEGHPLELIAFSSGRTPDHWRQAGGNEIFLGIDHSAISVADTDRSRCFYEQLGLARTGGSSNVGAEQTRLDDVAGATVEVSALSPPDPSTPHIELLSYRGTFQRPTAPLDIDSVAATRLVFTLDRAMGPHIPLPDASGLGPTRLSGQDRSTLLRDPDGHLLMLEPA